MRTPFLWQEAFEKFYPKCQVLQSRDFARDGVTICVWPNYSMCPSLFGEIYIPGHIDLRVTNPQAAIDYINRVKSDLDSRFKDVNLRIVAETDEQFEAHA